jgi:lipid A 3-O-deacylase
MSTKHAWPAVILSAVCFLSSAEVRAQAENPLPTGAMAECNSGAERMTIPRPGWLFTWENDSVIGPYGTDEFYTQGLQFGYRMRPDKQPGFLTWAMEGVCRGISSASEKDNRELVGAGSIFMGQHFFTPGNIEIPRLIRDDRPYAAWLYVGTRLEVAQYFRNPGRIFTSGIFHTFELQVGTLGPRAQGEWVQKRWHTIVPAPEPVGWDNQIPNEFGAQLRYSARGLVKDWAGKRKDGTKSGWQLQGTLDGDVNVGTILDAVTIGTTWRFGRNLGDPVSATLQPKFLPERLPLYKSSSSAVKGAPDDSADGATYVERNFRKSVDGDSPCFRPLRIEECYLFVSVAGHAVGFNAFLDGTMFHGGHSVDKEPTFAEVSWGARARWRQIQLDYTVTRTGREFSPVPRTARFRNGKHGFGALNLRCIAPIVDGDSHIDIVCPAIFSALVIAVASR